MAGAAGGNGNFVALDGDRGWPERWWRTGGRVQGCTEFAFDAEPDHADSHAMHRALGFAETEHVVYFRRDL